MPDDMHLTGPARAQADDTGPWHDVAAERILACVASAVLAIIALTQSWPIVLALGAAWLALLAPRATRRWAWVGLVTWFAVAVVVVCYGLVAFAASMD